MFTLESIILFGSVAVAVYYARVEKYGIWQQVAVAFLTILVVGQFMKMIGLMTPIEMFKHPDAPWLSMWTGDGEYKPYAPSSAKAREWRSRREFPVDGGH